MSFASVVESLALTLTKKTVIDSNNDKTFPVCWFEPWWNYRWIEFNLWYKVIVIAEIYLDQEFYSAPTNYSYFSILT